MTLLVLYFSLIGFLLPAFFGYKLGSRGVSLFVVFCIFNCLFFSFKLFYEVAILQSVCYLDIVSWIHLDTFFVNWSFSFDSVTVTMLVLVNIVSFCTNIYSMEYMLDDAHQSRFMSYLSLFTFFMLILVTSSNLMQLFIGWEGVGICSFLLINFWYTRLRANKSSLVAVFVNKVSDLILMLCFCFLFFSYNTLDHSIIISCYSIMFNSNLFFNSDSFFLFNSFICICLICAAIGKSAQVGLHIWLPEAMEGPTPVSSLIHAATMVTAGIFLVIKFSFLFHEFPILLLVIFFFGSLTTFFAASIGLFQNDLKKIIAYSTCSQLGYMFLSCGLLGYSYSLFHLMNHAFFKALLFLTAGYIIHSFLNEQDIRRMGGLAQVLPFPYILLTIASLSLIGLPFLSGFFSKEPIVDLMFNFFVVDFNYIFSYNFLFLFQFFAFTTIFFTIIYSIKLLFFVFFGKYNGYSYNIKHLHNSTFFTLFPLILLCLLSISSGYFTTDLMLGISTDFWNNSLQNSVISFSFFNQLQENSSFFLLEFEFNSYLHNITLFCVIYVIIISFLFFFFYADFFYFFIFYFPIFYFIYYHLNDKYIIFQKTLFTFFIKSILLFSYNVSYTFFDKGLLEVFGSYGLKKYIIILNKNSLFLSSGLLYHYLGFVLFFIQNLFFFFFLYNFIL